MVETMGRVGSLWAWADRVREAQERKREALDAWRTSAAETKRRKATLDAMTAALDGLVDDLTTLSVRGVEASHGRRPKAWDAEPVS